VPGNSLTRSPDFEDELGPRRRIGGPGRRGRQEFIEDETSPSSSPPGKARAASHQSVASPENSRQALKSGNWPAAGTDSLVMRQGFL